MNKSRKQKEPNYGVLRQEMAMLSDATPAQQHQIIKGMTVERLACLDAEFEHWAHKNQLPPDVEGWRTWLMMAGRGFGKTRAGAEWIYRLGNSRPNSRIALVGATIAEARSIMVEGVSGLLSVARRHRTNLRWEPSLGRLHWPNGSQAQLFSGDNADGLRGSEHHFAWGSAVARFCHCRSGDRTAARRSPVKPGRWRLLHCRPGSDGCVDRMGRGSRRIFRGRLAARPSGARNVFLRAVDRPVGLLSRVGVGDRRLARFASGH